jgi:hypothetical protein
MRTIGLLLASLTGLSALIAGTVLGLDRKLGEELVGAEEILPEPVVPHEATAVGTAEPGPDAPAAETTVEVVAPEPRAVEPAGPTMPDLSRERVDRATNQLRELGITLQVRDDYGTLIDRWSARGYRIRPESQTIAAGTTLAPGSTVRARAYQLASSFADGY